MGLSRRRALLPAFVVITVTLSGCLGGEARSEWAYDVTQLDDAAALGRSGAGVRIGVLDTGIDVTHPSLDHLVDGSQTNGELMGFRDFIDGRFGVGRAYDGDGHGTHVVGIMAARGSSFQDRLLYGGVDLKGGSPGASFYVARVCHETCAVDEVDAALEWLIEERVDIISLSLGGVRGLSQIFGDSTTSRINDAIDAGIVVVAAAGNSGEDPDSDDVEAPSDIAGVISVGAMDADLAVTAFSNRGDSDKNRCRPFPLDTFGRCSPDQKPELVAPGVEILSAWIDGNYVRASGTSHATPFVTSVIALMLEGHVDLRDADDVEALKEVLMETARPLPGQDAPHDDAAGYGLVQAFAAIEAYS